MLFDFIAESRAFRNVQNMEKYSVKDLSEIFYFLMLTLELMSKSDLKTVTKYCNDTVLYPNFTEIRLSATDLANLISTMKNAKKYLDEKDIEFPILELKRYFRDFKFPTMSRTLIRALFMKLHNRLKIQNSTIVNLRREIVDVNSIPKYQQIVLGKRLYFQLRRFTYNCDLIQLLHQFLEENDR